MTPASPEDPHLADPYESRMVEVRESAIEGASDGLFARRFIEVQPVIITLHLLRFPKHHISTGLFGSQLSET